MCSCMENVDYMQSKMGVQMLRKNAPREDSRANLKAVSKEVFQIHNCTKAPKAWPSQGFLMASVWGNQFITIESLLWGCV